MVAVQIRDVPDETRDALTRLAARKGQSLQAFLLDELNDVARRERNAAVFDSLVAMGGGSRLTGAEAQEDLDAARAERDARFAPTPSPMIDT